MNQQIKNFYERKWLVQDDIFAKRGVYYVKDMNFIDNPSLLTEPILNIVRSEKTDMTFACIFPEKTTIYYYEDVDVDHKPTNKSCKFEASSVIICTHWGRKKSKDSDIPKIASISYISFDNCCEPSYRLSTLEAIIDFDSTKSKHIFFSIPDDLNKGFTTRESAYALNQESLYQKVKKIKQQKIDDLVSSLYNLQLLDFELEY